MGIKAAIASVPVEAENRTWRVQMECPFDLAVQDRWVVFHREVVPLDAQGARAGDINQSIVPVGNNPAFRLEVKATLAQIKDKKFTGGGVTVTGAQIMALIAAAGDKLWEAAVNAELARQAVPIYDEDEEPV